MYTIAPLICTALLVANVAVLARPGVDSTDQGSADHVRQLRRAEPIDTNAPQSHDETVSTVNEKSAKRELKLEEMTIPVKLIFDDKHRDGRNVKTDDNVVEKVDQKGTEVQINELGVRKESSGGSEDSEQEKESVKGKEEREKENAIGPEARLLSTEERENDDNAKYGLLIQSRNRADTIYSQNIRDPTFTYGLRALPFNTFVLSKNQKHEDAFTGSVTHISPGNFDVRGDDEQSVVVGNEDEEREPNVKRRIQHYQYVIKPSRLLFGNQQYPGAVGHPFLQQQQPAPLFNWAPSYYRQNMFAPQNQIPVPFSIYPANRVQTQGNFQRVTEPSTKLFDDYFPIIVNNPFNEIWLGLTNIVEYGPGADVCRSDSGKAGRRADDDDKETELDLSSPRRGEPGPQITRLKVRRGGVAIAGPGGIATAGSGGTAIVGPGGTAYTTPSGTAVVGPGGKVVHVPEFPLFKGGDGSEPRIFEIPSNGKLMATGPVVYYDPPSPSVN